MSLVKYGSMSHCRSKAFIASSVFLFRAPGLLPVWPAAVVESAAVVSRAIVSKRLIGSTPHFVRLVSHHGRLGLEPDEDVVLDRKSVGVGKECRSRWSPYH